MSNLEDLSIGLIGDGRADERPASARGARVIERLVSGLRAGQLRVVLPSGPPLRIAGREPGPQATVVLKRWRAVRRLALGGDVGFAESFVDGDWTSPDLVALVRLAARNMETFDRAISGSKLLRAVERLRHLLRRNSRRGSRRNIVAHYDLGNAFYSLWLDGAMQYSSGIFETGAETLETAQARKIARIAELMKLDGGESVLEIGCGWGGLAERLASKKNVRVTALTLSPAQRTWASALAVAGGLVDRIDVRLQDYRYVRGSFDRIVSIEMLEAVGEAWWPTYFRVLADRLKPGGRTVLQVITIADERYEAYRRAPDFIQKHVFPGGFLPSASALTAQIAAAGLRLTHRETFGSSYARTLAEWRARFIAHWPDIAAQGFDERFRRLWTYYLCYCEAGFAEGAIDVGLYVIARAAQPESCWPSRVIQSDSTLVTARDPINVEATMTNRRTVLAGLALAAVAMAAPAQAFEIRPYDAAAAQKAIASGRPVIVHIYAPWCLQCHIQASILDGLKADPAYDKAMVFRVDYDNQKDVVAKLDCPRSTVIAFKGGKEVKRMSWGVTQASVVDVLAAAM